MPENTRGMGRETTRRRRHRRVLAIRSAGSAAGTLDPMAYEVRTPVYEGPFDLLLHLILKQEVELWEVSLAEIIDAYLAELERLETLDLDVATEFLLIAATLVELKARRLLPGLETSELDEELLRFEERDLLLARLLECKTFKDAAAALEGASAAPTAACRAPPGPRSRSAGWRPTRSSGSGPTRCAPPRCGCSRRRRSTVVDTDHVAPIRASVRDAVESVLRLLPDVRADELPGAGGGRADRIEVIVRFLAVLELYKQGVVDLTAVHELRRPAWSGACTTASRPSTSPASTTGTSPAVGVTTSTIELDDD